MDTNKAFELSSRKKLRFEGPKGLINSEDLWNLGENRLKAMFVELKGQQAAAPIDALAELDPTLAAPSDDDLVVKLAVVRHIYNTLKSERLAAEQAQVNKELKRKLLTMAAEKENKLLFDELTPEQLRAKAQEL